MDNKQEPTTTTPTPSVSTQPATGAVINPTPAPVANSTPSSLGSTPVIVQAAASSKSLFIVIAVVLILIIGGGAYWYYSQLSSAPQPVEPVVNTQSTSKPEKDKTIAELETDLQNLVASDPAGDFTAIDQDLNNL
jgi:hypothetical protein